MLISVGSIKFLNIIYNFLLLWPLFEIFESHVLLSSYIQKTFLIKKEFSSMTWKPNAYTIYFALVRRALPVRDILLSAWRSKPILFISPDLNSLIPNLGFPFAEWTCERISLCSTGILRAPAEQPLSVLIYSSLLEDTWSFCNYKNSTNDELNIAML